MEQYTPRAPIPADHPPTSATGEGRLLFQITTASGAIPLSGAAVTVRRIGEEGAERGSVIAVLKSDGDGKTDMLPLPAPARSFSLEPTRDGAPLPYALYDADVTLDGFFTQSFIRIPVFDGITSIQRASLIPLPENGYSDGLRPDAERFVEGESPDL